MTKTDSATRYAILGLLTIKPGSGYDLRRLAEQSVGHFWSESYGQIYPTLKQLENERLVTRRNEAAPGRPEKHVYSITEAGRDELRAWLERAPKPQPPRQELLLKLFFGTEGDPAIGLEHVSALHEEERKQLAEYDRIEASLKKNHARHPSLSYWLMTLRFGRYRSQAMLRWARETEAELRNLKGNSRRRMTRPRTQS